MNIKAGDRVLFLRAWNPGEFVISFREKEHRRRIGQIGKVLIAHKDAADVNFLYETFTLPNCSLVKIEG